MCGYTEYTINNYVESKCDLRAKIAAIDAIITANQSLMLQTALSQAGGTAMYELDDGQVRIKVAYRSLDELVKTMESLEKVKNNYINQLNGRTTKLRGLTTLRGGYGYGGCGC